MIHAAALVTMLLRVTCDLDRLTRALITVPSTPLKSLRASMALPPGSAPALSDDRYGRHIRKGLC
jgi:hypothetical protein